MLSSDDKQLIYTEMYKYNFHDMKDLIKTNIVFYDGDTCTKENANKLIEKLR